MTPAVWYLLFRFALVGNCFCLAFGFFWIAQVVMFDGFQVRIKFINQRHTGGDVQLHDFIFGDVFDWLRRFQKRHRRFDVVLLDPPTFSQSRESGVFQASKDYGKLVAAALGVLQPGGLLFASNNTADWEPSLFLETVRQACHSARRRIAHEHYVPQPPDFPISRAEPAYLKTVWVRLAD